MELEDYTDGDSEISIIVDRISRIDRFINRGAIHVVCSGVDYVALAGEIAACDPDFIDAFIAKIMEFANAQG